MKKNNRGFFKVNPRLFFTLCRKNVGKLQKITHSLL